MAVRSSPTIEVIVVILGMFIVQQLLELAGYGSAWVGLALPLGVRPWTIVTSVYAHSTVEHLVTNVIALGLVGFVIERVTTRARFHAFVAGLGAIAGITEVIVNGVLGQAVLVLGVSGAVLGLYGYAVTGNVVIGGVLDRFRLGRRGQIALFVVLALGVTILTAGSSIAMVAHFTGFLLGLFAGRARVLHT